MRLPALSAFQALTKAVDVIITELAVFDFHSGTLTLTELMPGVKLDEVKAKTSASFNISLKQ